MEARWILGIEIKVGLTALIEVSYEKSLNKMYRVLKPGKYCVIVIGNAIIPRKRNCRIFMDYRQKTGFKLVKIDKIIYSLYNIMQKENILIFQKV